MEEKTDIIRHGASMNKFDLNTTHLFEGILSRISLKKYRPKLETGHSKNKYVINEDQTS